MKIHEISIEMSWVELTLDSPGHQAHEQKPCLQLLGSIAGTGIWQLQRCFHGHFMDISWTFHGHFMDISWTFHGHFMDISWTFHGHFMGSCSPSGKALVTSPSRMKQLVTWRLKAPCGVLWHYGIVWELRIILIILIFYDILIFFKSYFHLFSYSHYNILPHVQRSFPRL